MRRASGARGGISSGRLAAVAVVAAVVAFTAIAACMALPQGQQSSNPSSIPQSVPSSFIAWTGVKAVAETLTPTPADPAAPVALAEGLGGVIYAQWNTTTSATLTRFSSSGAELASPFTRGGRAGRSAAVPTCSSPAGAHKDWPALAVDTTDGFLGVAPELVAKDPSGSSHDWDPGSTLGMIVPGGGARAFVAARYNLWPSSTGPGPDVNLIVGPIKVAPTSSMSPLTCTFDYAANDLYAATMEPQTAFTYLKGRILPLGLPATFAVGAAGRSGADGLVVAGTNTPTGPGWIVSLDSALRIVHQGSLPIAGSLSVTVASVAVDASGSVFVCGGSRSNFQLNNSQNLANITNASWVLQGAPDLTSWQVLPLPGTPGGCALTRTGALVVSGTYLGTFSGQTSQSADGFLALVTPGAGAAAPTLAKFARYGSIDVETIVSAPLVTSDGRLFVGGVTRGNWGLPSGTSSGKVFVARFDPATLALQ